MKLETHVLDIIEGRKSAPLMRGILHAMSQCYHASISLRNFAYDQKIIASVKLPIPLVSVGNIVAGGTGKTPFVHYLANSLMPSTKVAILSRGYRRKMRHTCIVNENTSPRDCGDEPYLLFQKLPRARIIVGKNRIHCAHLAMQLGAQIVLLDDGMQHRQLDRDREIGVMHADDLFGKGFYLPRGLLRDNPKRLAKTNLMIVNGINDEAHFEKIQTLLKHYSSAPMTAMGLQVENSSQIASKKVGAFCAIAAPHRFFATLKTLGCDVILKEEKPDHFPFAKEELERFANRASREGAQCLVCTEKDAVKLPKNLKLSLPIIPVQIALTPTFGKEHLETFIQQIKEEINERRI